VHSWFILTTNQAQAVGTQHCRVYENLARCCQWWHKREKDDRSGLFFFFWHKHQRV